MEDKVLHCSFCGKSQNEVKKLIAGKSVHTEDGRLETIFICDECIGLCQDIINEEQNITEMFGLDDLIKALQELFS